MKSEQVKPAAEIEMVSLPKNNKTELNAYL